MDETTTHEAPPSSAPQPAPSAPAPVGQLLSPTELLRQAWELYKAKASLYLQITALPMVLAIIFNLVTLGTVATTSRYGVSANPTAFASFGVVAFVLVILLIIAYLFSTIGLLVALKHRNEQLSLSQIFGQSRGLIGGFLLVALITGLIVLGGLILLIIPGIIFALWYSFSSYAFIDQGKRGMDALRESKRLVSGRLWPVFLRGLFIGVIVWLISFGVSIIFGIVGNPEVSSVASSIVQWLVTPISVAYGYLMYEDFKRTRN